ncbi:hypothetical protein [Vitiosangium sp. GDMCC 1.1324]|uniref:hypothetical protein n=1 Tax=Vitiosangium sp. (strain GDMCC 1.1324) TaxID=2138576 RepID=UPI00130E44CE|nr:hypothetical protein [Vitiosangium sp. GDMCC 1.1324]
MAIDPKDHIVLSMNASGRLVLGAIDNDGHIGITGFLQGAPGAGPGHGHEGC